jgi:signal transduction histidine kinase
MHRLDRVVQTLADFTRPMTLDLREHDMRRLMAKVVELTSAELTGHDIALQVAEPAEPVVVCVDGELIQQALLNLVLNGMQAMPEGGQLALRLRRERQFAVLEVVDNGQGIPPEVMPRIFELYFTTKEKGSGIGLAMTYRILQMHGGAMEVWSTVAPRPDLGDLPLARGREGAGPEGKGIEAEHGTAFTLKLPIVAPAAGGLA